jgi:hypothetical protein
MPERYQEIITSPYSENKNTETDQITITMGVIQDRKV